VSKIWKQKWFWLAVVAALLLGLGFWEVFPDPYYHQTNVNFYVWAYRELDELVHGEK
jgi:hypothetical protein